MFSITSIDPIRAAVASGNEDLARRLAGERISGYTEEDLQDEVVLQDIEEWRSVVESLLTCPKPPREEPGSWSVLLDDVARHLGLLPLSLLPFNEGWKHLYCWRMYRKAVDRHITKPSRKILAHLDEGRPLRGKTLDYDGCQFAWLRAGEVRELHHSLSRLEKTVISETDLVDFHETLVESLRIVGCQDRDLILGSC